MPNIMNQQTHIPPTAHYTESVLLSFNPPPYLISLRPFLSVWQASVSAAAPLGINGLPEYAVIRSTNLVCGQLIAGD